MSIHSTILAMNTTVSYLDELQIASELDDLNTNPIEVSFTYDDTLMYYSYWTRGGI